ncbi:hypothetical protein QUF64_10980 [Anaerolineales bacterium HSG6]|nr:hypothetical protein [Anaerolineales bacterium HSG6]MDM8529600.1 hypothetical protein [Anaerolineales bacterium HSG25]
MQKQSAFALRYCRIPLIFCTLIVLACGGQMQRHATPPTGLIVVKQEAAQQLKQNAYQALAEASDSYTATFRVTDEQITSLVALELTRTGQIPIRKPQIWFRSGQIHVTGFVSAVVGVNVTMHLIGSAFVQDGQLLFEITSAQTDYLDLPQTTLPSLTQTINEALAELPLEVEITQVKILDGEMQVKGKRDE